MYPEGREINHMNLTTIKDPEGREHTVYMPDEFLNHKRNHQTGMVIPKDALVTVPGSKSMTNRALLMAALSEKESVLEGVLFSDDSRHFLSSLKNLGFEIDIDEKNRVVKLKGTGGRLPQRTGAIDVGSAGTAARFLTAMLALSDGCYTINCSEQMEKRPMKPLFDVLEGMGAKFTYLKNEGYLPVEVQGNRYQENGVENDKTEKIRKIRIDMDISKSTQFLSAMLMVAPVMEYDLDIVITSEKKTGAYIEITTGMLKEFAVEIEFDGNEYHIKGKQKVNIGSYCIEPDVSAACYFFAAAAITGGSVTVRNISYRSMQGDMKFLEVLTKIGCEVREKETGMYVKGPDNGVYPGIDVNMNNFSDQALTLAAVAAYATTPTVIRNVGHIRGQECDRMAAIANNLNKCNIEVKLLGDDIIITPGVVHGAMIETYEDHRVAMAFNLLSLRTRGVIIDNPMCCKKTFENYYEVFESMF